MTKPDLKAPSFNIEAQIEEHVENRDSKNKKSATIILILIGVIICLLLIIISLLLAPSPAPDAKEDTKVIPVKKEKSEIIINKQVKQVSEKVVIETTENKIIKNEIKKEQEPEREILTNKKAHEQEQELKLKEKALDDKFNNKITSILSALEKNKFTLAANDLADAEKLKPDEAIIKELKERINIQTKNVKIRILIKKAQLEEKNERWNNALNYYEEILKVDANINSIIVNKQRTKIYIKINETLNKIINKPERLQSDKVLHNSKKLLKFVNLEIKEKEDLLYPLEQTPQLTKKLINTEKIIKNASINIAVTIRSDNLTEVVVYKIGNFGKLTEKILNLRPGHYTIVGSREGYRDYRRVLKISSGDKSIVIRVECRETI